MARGDQSEPLPVYELRPPAWLPKSHISADLGELFRYRIVEVQALTIVPSGYTGFHPPRPHQVEEVLTETNVKNGLVIPQSVPVWIGMHASPQCL